MSDAQVPLARGSAPGKVILFGEHAVVYGRPAIAAPVPQVRARARIFPASRCTIEAPDIHQRIDVARAPADDPFARAVRLACQAVGEPLPPWRIVVTSDIPIAAGLGSGAAIAAAVIRALLAGFEHPLEDAVISSLVFEVEKIHHGSPSGIDNTVVVYERPVWFVRGHPPEPFAVAHPIHLLIADTGVPSPTRDVVEAVRRARAQEPARFEALFDEVEAIAHQARAAIEGGDIPALGPLMNANQELLAQMGVSSPALERLIAAARAAGARGAKLSGAGRGGNMIALVAEADMAQVAEALRAAGAARVLATTIGPATPL
jgi:mevalonate kinase